MSDIGMEVKSIEELFPDEAVCSCCLAVGPSPCGCYWSWVHHESPTEVNWTEIHCSTHRKGFKVTIGEAI